MISDAGAILRLHAAGSIGRGIHIAEPSWHNLAGGVAAICINTIPVITFLGKNLAVSAIRHANSGCGIVVVLRDTDTSEIGGVRTTEISRGVADITVFACGYEGGVEAARKVEADPVD